MLYMITFTINIPPMLAYIPYMDPMGKTTTLQSPEITRNDHGISMASMSATFLSLQPRLSQAVAAIHWPKVDFVILGNGGNGMFIFIWIGYDWIIPQFPSISYVPLHQKEMDAGRQTLIFCSVFSYVKIFTGTHVSRRQPKVLDHHCR